MLVILIGLRQLLVRNSILLLVLGLAWFVSLLSIRLRLSKNCVVCELALMQAIEWTVADGDRLMQSFGHRV